MARAFGRGLSTMVLLSQCTACLPAWSAGFCILRLMGGGGGGAACISPLARTEPQKPAANGADLFATPEPLSCLALPAFPPAKTNFTLSTITSLCEQLVRGRSCTIASTPIVPDTHARINVGKMAFSSLLMGKHVCSTPAHDRIPRNPLLVLCLLPFVLLRHFPALFRSLRSCVQVD